METEHTIVRQLTMRNVFHPKYSAWAASNFSASVDDPTRFIDHTKRLLQFDGWLRKLTVAPQIGADRQFFSRPVLRTFLTYANWSDGLGGVSL